MRKAPKDEASVRKLIREALFGNFNPPPDESISAANVSNVIDPSASDTDPTNPNFRPQSRQELVIAVTGLLNCVEDDYAGEAYEMVKKALEGDEDLMTPPKQEDNVIGIGVVDIEEAVRQQIRKMITAEAKEDDRTYVVKKKRHSSVNEQDADAADKDADEEEHEKRKNQSAVTWSGGTFDQIAKELGVSVSGAKRLVTVALAKAQYVGSIDQDELEIITLEAMKDYIAHLQSSGELTPADVQLLQDHPSLTGELEGFREFLSDAIKEHEEDTRPVDNDRNRLNPYDKGE